MIKYQKKLMNNILWSFINYYSSVSAFTEALKSYNEEISGEPFLFDALQIVLNTPKVTIQYMYWDEEEDDIVESDFELIADNLISFSACELLYKVNNKVFEKLKLVDNHFFEGFQLFEGKNPNTPDVPLYFLLQGS